MGHHGNHNNSHEQAMCSTDKKFASLVENKFQVLKASIWLFNRLRETKLCLFVFTTKACKGQIIIALKKCYDNPGNPTNPVLYYMPQHNYIHNNAYLI